MVIWMDQLLTGNLIGPVGNDLIYVHIGLGAASGLPYSQRKMTVKLSCQNLITDCRYEGKACFIQLSQTVIGHGRCLFQDRKCPYYLHRDLFCSDFKVFKAALGLSPPITVCRNLDFSHGIVFSTVLHDLLASLRVRRNIFDNSIPHMKLFENNLLYFLELFARYGLSNFNMLK